MSNVFDVIGKVQSDKLSCMGTGLVKKGENVRRIVLVNIKCESLIQYKLLSRDREQILFLE